MSFPPRGPVGDGGEADGALSAVGHLKSQGPPLGVGVFSTRSSPSFLTFHPPKVTR